MRLPAPRVPWFLRPLHWWQRKRYGVVLQPTALWSYRPRALLAFLALFSSLRGRRSPVSLELRTLVCLRVSQLCNCAFCIDMNAALVENAGLPAEKALALADWRSDPQFSEPERLALAYAEAMTCTPPVVVDELFGQLRASFTPEAIVELTAMVAVQNLSARFNAALQAQAHGFCGIDAGSSRTSGGDSPAPGMPAIVSTPAFPHRRT